MSDYSAISDVSETLRTILDGALSVVDAVAQPHAEFFNPQSPPSGNPATLTLFLYEISEDTSLRNRAPRTIPDGAGYKSQKPPLPLILRYLITAWGGDRLTEHKMLGRALQVLHDGQVLLANQLSGGLKQTAEAISVTLAPLSLEERTRVWWSIQQPYHLSLNYEVRVVDLDTEVSDPLGLVGQRDLAYANVETAK